MSTYQVNTHPGSHLAGAPDGSANLGPQRPRTKGKAGWDFFSLACTDWPRWLHFNIDILKPGSTHANCTMNQTND